MIKLCDCHTDFLTEIKNKRERTRYAKSLAGDTISCAVFTTENKYNIQDIEGFKNEVEFYNKNFNAKFLFSIEDAGAITKKEDIKKLINLKPFSITLTWNNKNDYGGGALCEIGLTKKGKQLIEKFEENKIILDYAHLNRKSFFDALKISKKPIFVSHANIDSCFSHRRNLIDRQIEMLVESDGFLGLTIYQKFISNNKISSKDIAKQFDYLIKKFGENNFGFGSDLFGFSKQFLPFDIKGYSDFEKIEKELLKLGYNEKIINKIFFENFENFIKKYEI